MIFIQNRMGAASITNCCDEGYETQKLSIEVMAEEIAAAGKQRTIRGSSFRTAGTTNVSASMLSSTMTSDEEIMKLRFHTPLAFFL